MAREGKGAISFDDLARGLADGTITRGKAIRLMGGALVGAALASVPGIARANDDDDRCSEGQTRCGERCVNLKTNERHCGSCRNRCASNQTCCKGRCVNLQRNERHCGECFNRCAEGQECVEGMCQGGGCQGTPLTQGDCNCASICLGGESVRVTCQDNPQCACVETTEGTGFCAFDVFVCGNLTTCSSSSECSSDYQCTVGTCFNEECDPTAVGFCRPSCSSVVGSRGS